MAGKQFRLVLARLLMGIYNVCLQEKMERTCYDLSTDILFTYQIYDPRGLEHVLGWLPFSILQLQQVGNCNKHKDTDVYEWI